MSDTVGAQLPAHAPFGPSAAEGWSTCLDYVRANRGLPDDSGPAAAEGTFAHLVADQCLALGLDADEMVGMRMRVRDWTFEWKDDDADLLQPGIDWIRAQPGQFFGERRVDISPWTVPGQFGTLDRAVLGDDIIIIEDLKWGRKFPHSPVRHKQLVLYALGFWNDVARHRTGTTDFLLRIDQPRCGGGGGDWLTTLAELKEIGEWLRERAQLAATMENPPRTASEKGCLWCRRRRAPGGCDTYESFLVTMLGMTFDDLDGDSEPALQSAMTPRRRAKLLRHKDVIEEWLERHYADALADALGGADAGGLKAVAGRKKPDKWQDAEAASARLAPLLGEGRFKKTLLTPNQAKKALGAERAPKIAELIDEGGRDPVLVGAEDSRAPYREVTVDEFEPLQEAR